jgi:hypothetical protein
MSSTNMPTPFLERPRAYSPPERRVMDIYKAQYMQTTTPAERRALAQAKIFPDLFTYWSSIGIDLNPTEKNIREDVSTFSITGKKCSPSM